MECVKIDKNYKDVFKNLHFHSKSRVDVFERTKMFSKIFIGHNSHGYVVFYILWFNLINCLINQD